MKSTQDQRSNLNKSEKINSTNKEKENAIKNHWINAIEYLAALNLKLINQRTNKENAREKNDQFQSYILNVRSHKKWMNSPKILYCITNELKKLSKKSYNAISNLKLFNDKQQNLNFRFNLSHFKVFISNFNLSMKFLFKIPIKFINYLYF